MKCMRCGNDSYPDTNTEAVELEGGGLLIIRNIPCYKCRECDEISYTGDIVERLEAMTAEARARSQELTVINMIAAGAMQAPC